MELIRIPKASENMETATVGRWHCRVGDSIEKGEPLVELITDKAQFDYEAEVSGTLRRIIALPKSLLPVGYVIALIGDEAEPLPDAAQIDEENARLTSRMRGTVAPAAGRPGRAAAPVRTRGKRIPAKPAARKLAKENGVDLADVAKAAGKKGPLTQEDIRQYIENAG